MVRGRTGAEEALAVAAGEAEIRARKAIASTAAAGVVLEEILAARQANSVATKALRAALGSWKEKCKNQGLQRPAPASRKNDSKGLMRALEAVK